MFSGFSFFFFFFFVFEALKDEKGIIYNFPFRTHLCVDDAMTSPRLRFLHIRAE